MQQQKQNQFAPGSGALAFALPEQSLADHSPKELPSTHMFVAASVRGLTSAVRGGARIWQESADGLYLIAFPEECEFIASSLRGKLVYYVLKQENCLGVLIYEPEDQMSWALVVPPMKRVA